LLFITQDQNVHHNSPLNPSLVSTYLIH